MLMLWQVAGNREHPAGPTSCNQTITGNVCSNKNAYRVAEGQKETEQKTKKEKIKDTALLKRCNATERAGKNKKVVAPGMKQKEKQTKRKPKAGITC